VKRKKMDATACRRLERLIFLATLPALLLFLQ
jgi:hypothetical protein